MNSFRDPRPSLRVISSHFAHSSAGILTPFEGIGYVCFAIVTILSILYDPGICP